MKLKLKVTKNLKKNLKDLSNKVELERKDYVKAEVLSHIKENKKDWCERIDGYAEFLENRSKNLENLKAELAEDLEISSKEKQARLRNFYKENLMFDRPTNKNKKLENIIIDLDEHDYYALQILSENKEMTIEDYTVEVLQHLK